MLDAASKHTCSCMQECMSSCDSLCPEIWLFIFFFWLLFQHCIKGKTLYAPQIVHLSCDGSSAIPNGHWFHYSYGTVAVYKEDWEKFGGFSTLFDNKVTWGGEDWDMIDGAVKGGLEIERKRSAAVYHYYHTKAGMWQKAKRTIKGTSGTSKT